MQQYGENWQFKPDMEFEKWAAVEVADTKEIPQGMETYQINGGLYAVFVHHGPASAAEKTMQYIFGEWLPNSPYNMDSREHFEILPEGYNPVEPNAQEEIWVPVKEK